MIDIWQYLGEIGSLQIIGLMGFLIYMMSFGLVQIDHMDGNGRNYTLCNMLAASLVAVSLFAEFNLSSALIQGSWILIGFVGLLKRQLRKEPSIARLPTAVPCREVA